MSATQLQQELQNELTTSNQLLKLISLELQQIKEFTSPEGIFENNIKENAILLETLANMRQIDLENIDPIPQNAKARSVNKSASNTVNDSL